MLKNYMDIYNEIDRYTLGGIWTCTQQIGNWMHDPLQYAKSLFNAMEEEAEELAETVESTAQEVVEVLLTQYMRNANYMLNRVLRNITIDDGDMRSRGIAYYTAKRDKAAKWLEQYESANN